MKEKIKKLLERCKEVEDLLQKKETLENKKLYKELSLEYSFLSQIKKTSQDLEKVFIELSQNKKLLEEEKDPEFLLMLKEEIEKLNVQKNLLEKKIYTLLVPKDPRDDKNIILEIRAGTGGQEAALFASDIVKMYQGYASFKKWSVETISATPSDLGGYKEYIMAVSGKNVFKYLRYEAGTHRVQRVPETETQGRLHTSAVTVAVFVEPDKEDVKIDDRDLRIETYRASGAGGQHVNVTDSAVRITHIPTNIVVTCQDERSQHKNKAKAMRLLLARVSEGLKQKKEKEISKIRSMQVGSGDRSERIRTYNIPQNRITDHRASITLYKLDKILHGDLEELLEGLILFFSQKVLDEKS